MDRQLAISSPKRAFYPCCGSDVIEPRNLLRGLVNEIIYCDRNQANVWRGLPMPADLPRAAFLRGDVRLRIADLPDIDLLFYRRDSEGEGGSGVYVLSAEWLAKILGHFPASGGLIITDGSNSRNGLFKKMIRPGGYAPASGPWCFSPSPIQTFLQKYGLHTIQVRRKDQAV
jgi:hypothetical protein